MGRPPAERLALLVLGAYLIGASAWHATRSEWRYEDLVGLAVPTPIALLAGSILIFAGLRRRWWTREAAPEEEVRFQPESGTTAMPTTEREPDPSVRRGPSPGELPELLGGTPGEVALAVLVTGASTVAAWFLDRTLAVGSLALVFLCGVLLVAVRSRTSIAILAAILGFVAYNFFFTEPRFSLRIDRAQDLLAVVAFLVAALLVGQLASRQHAQLVALRIANQHARALQTLGESLAVAADSDEVYRAGSATLAASLGCDAVVVRPETGAGTAAPVAPDTGDPQSWSLPMTVEGRSLGSVELRFAAGRPHPTAEQRALAEAVVQQVAQAAERTRLVASLEAARVEGETERLRTALLSSVSHDLRSPLAAVIGAATSLASYGDSLNPVDRLELIESIRSEGQRLDRYIQNLLDMTRIGSGPLRLERDWVSLEEILDSAVARLRRLFPTLEVVTRVTPGLPPLFVHAALIEQALFNVFENAAKFSPAGAPVEVDVRRREDQMVVDVMDRGPGIPELDRGKVFDLFYSAASGDRGERGTGLGLTIVRGMINAHGGRVEALGRADGHGTILRLSLPLTEPPAAEIQDDEA
jgi:two-component system sensor histidine kinase KdpD